MNKVYRLTRVFLKTGGIFSYNKKKNTNIWLIPLLGLAFLPIIIQLGYGSYALTEILSNIGVQSLILYLAMISCLMIIFLFGIFYILGIFYLAKDIETVLTLPLKPWEILSARFITVLLYEYLLMCIILAPVLIGYGLASKAGVLFIIYSIAVFLTLPVIALCIAAFPVLLIMRFTSFAKNRDVFKYFTGIFALVIALGFNFGIQKLSMGFAGTEQIYDFVENSNQSVLQLGKSIPGVTFAVDALVKSNQAAGLINILLFIFVAVLSYAIFMFLGKMLYFKGVIGINESSAKRMSISSASMTKKMNKRSRLNSYVLKELRLLFRTPIYFMNCILINFIFPVFLIIPMLIQGDINSMTGQLSEFLNTNGGMALSIIFAIALFMASSNAITATTISREGTGLYVMKYLPIPMEKQMMHKVVSGIIISSIAIVLIIGILFFLGMPLIITLLSAVLSINAMIYTALTGIIIDMHNPKLNWDNEQAAVKQNLNVLINMLFAIIAGFIGILPTALLKLNIFSAFVYILIMFILINRLLYGYIKRNSENLLMKLD